MMGGAGERRDGEGARRRRERIKKKAVPMDKRPFCLENTHCLCSLDIPTASSSSSISFSTTAGDDSAPNLSRH